MTPPKKAALQFTWTEDPFSFAVLRRDSQEVLFNSSGWPMVFETQYVRIQTKLPNEPNLYGLGEHSDSFRLETSNYTRTLWNAESPNLPPHENLYGSHPVYFEHRAAAGTHGVFLLSSSGMDIKINRTEQRGQYLEYNTIGGVLDFYFMAGPTPQEVSQQYAEIVGLPAMMPYWVLGLHQCKNGYYDVLEVAEVVTNYSAASIPLETMWTDIDYMDLRQDFTLDPLRFPLHKMQELANTLHERDQHYVVILDPAIHQVQNYSTYARGEEKQVFLKNADGSDYLGVQWAGIQAWPDWLAPSTQDWWSDEIAMFFDAETGINIDGLWNDMQEASNFCPDTQCVPAQVTKNRNIPPPPTSTPRADTGREIPGFPPDFQPPGEDKLEEISEPTEAKAVRPKSHSQRSSQETASWKRKAGNGKVKGLADRDLFRPNYTIQNHQGPISDHTIYTNITNADETLQYDTHNFYGIMMANHTRNALLSRNPGKRPFVLARSTFAGAGKYVAHWFGDNYSNWTEYRVSMSQMLAFTTIHQMQMVGSDVCGFNGVTNSELCARWAMLGAFQPFYRNHDTLNSPQQEFYQWPIVAQAARKAISARFRALDYFYTALNRASESGTPATMPLWYLYPEDANTFGIQYQYFFGDALMISPVTEENSTSVTAYMPDDVFYDFWTLKKIRGKGANVTLRDVSLTDIPIHIRGGTILPLRSESANTTTRLRKKSFSIIVAPGKDGTANGQLYLDDGESLDVGTQRADISFSWDGHTLSVDGNFGYNPNVGVKDFVILGQEMGRHMGVFSADRGSVTVSGPWKLNRPFSVRP